MTDPIADYCTRLRNAAKARHRVVDIPASGLKKEITKLLFDKGYILNYRFEENPVQDNIKIAMKFDPVTKKCAFEKIQRMSKPGLRKYAKSQEMPRVLNGLGVAVVSTSKGVMSDKEARSANVGGEVLFSIY